MRKRPFSLTEDIYKVRLNMDRRLLIELILEHSEKSDIYKTMHDGKTITAKLTQNFYIEMNGLIGQRAVTCKIIDEDDHTVQTEVIHYFELGLTGPF